MQNSNSNLERAVAKVLWEKWDPIGVNASEPYENEEEGYGTDEYDSYVPKIVQLLQEGCDNYALTEHLTRLERDAMGLQTNRPHNEKVSMQLLQLFSEDKSFGH